MSVPLGGLFTCQGQYCGQFYALEPRKSCFYPEHSVMDEEIKKKKKNTKRGLNVVASGE